MTKMLTELPSDIVRLIVEVLPREDVKNFRQVSRWAEKEAFEVFATFFCRHRTLHLNARDSSQLDPLPYTQALRSRIHTLTVYLPTTSQFGHARLDEQHKAWLTGKVARIIASYSGLRELILDPSILRRSYYTDDELIRRLNDGSENHRDSLDIVTQALAVAGSNMTKITHLEVNSKHTGFCEQILASLLEIVSPDLVSLKLTNLSLEPFYARLILSILQESASSLAQVTIVSLVSRYRSFTVMGQHYVKAFPDSKQGGHGKQITGKRRTGWLCMRGSLATMDCREAVEFGLRKMLDSLVEVEEA